MREKQRETLTPVAAIILAAGGSVRMGKPKQLLPIAGRPMVRHTAEAVCSAGLAQVVVVVGAYAEAVQQALLGLSLEIVVNPTWSEGMSGSVRAGIGALRSEIQAALLVLADQPTLTPGLLQILVDRYRASEAPIVAPFFHGRRGNPVLFARALFPELATVEGDQGGRTLISRYQAQMERVETEDPAVRLDIDTHQDYESLKEMLDAQKMGR